ncbi:MAG: hypothetical protein EOO74_05960 [Myxococcales bacterium]|nr:MAG: hypothetical protein EOO74_05960 [Myxococcales bacterium]
MAHLRARVVPAAGLVGLLALGVTTGCGSTEEKSPSTASKVVQECRAQWAELTADWDARAESGFPSDLAARWSALAAGGSYESSVADDDCEDPLHVAEINARTIERLSGSLRTYDLVWQYGDVNDKATSWLTTAKARPARQVRRALAVLERTAPLAVADMDAAWRAAVQADLSDPDAMRDLADSMAFVAGDSAPYRQGAKALRKVERLISRR